MEGVFDPATFLNTTLTDALDTKRTAVPAGEYLAICGKPDVRKVNKKDGSGELLFLEVPLFVDDQEAREVTGLDNPSVRYSSILDLSPNGGIDTGKGKNIGLGRLRDAIGMNQPGKPFSFANIEGKPIRCMVVHRIDGEEKYADVKAISKA